MYKFEPILKTLVWGTESWVLSSVPGSESVVAEGPEAGKTLSEVYGGEFPLLIKFIDARKDLSIQVHPGDELAGKRHGGHGKDEMWYIIGAAEGAHLYSGLAKPLTPEEYARRVEDGTIIDVLGDHVVAPGDVFFIPSGRIHSICGGCYLAEIQQTSDITYRIYDYNRPGLDGKPRQLHTELAKDAIDYTVADDYRTHYERRENEPVELLKCEHFTTTLFELSAPLSCPAPGGGRWLTVACASGSGTVNGAALRAGQALLLTPDENHLDLVPTAPDFRLLTSYC
ncbi:MAG: mannose-6-phosphate isomerase [Bacteroidales bacterium]|nr:mannose-6-phosphate isomerase [Bacteroidales bacterium]